MNDEERIEVLLNNRKLYERNKSMRYSDTLAPWKQRFCEEYWDLKDRCDKLEEMLKKWDQGNLDFIPNCPYTILNAQYACMLAYRSILLERASIENIDLFKWHDENEEK